MEKQYVVCLTPVERAALLELVWQGCHSIQRLRRAQVLLLADEGKTDAAIAQTLHMGIATIQRVRRQYAREGLAHTLGREFQAPA